MQFWQSPIPLTLLALAGFLVTGELLRHAIAPLRRAGIPASILGGCVGLLLGPGVLGWVPVDTATLEALVYHGLAVVFIAISLQEPPPSQRGGGAASLAFAIPAMIALQSAVGLGAVLLLGTLAGEHLHPGFGLMLPMGFDQGPGQALSVGGAWEQGGMPDGSQVGLIVAAIGFAWSIGLGVPLVALGRRKGWVAQQTGVASDGTRFEHSAPSLLPAGAVELLTRQILAIAVCYLVTIGVVAGLAKLLAPLPGLAAMAWGFHFIVGAGVALAARALLRRLPWPTPLHPDLLGRISGVSVDALTCAALTAVQLAVLGRNWLPILLVTSLGGLITFAFVMWIARRAFPDEPFEHAVMFFGMATGTLPTGLALLRMLDPELKGSAPRSAVIGSAGAILPAAPIVLLLIPLPIAAFPDSYPLAGWACVGLLIAYFSALLAVWWWSGQLDLRQPWRLLAPRR